MKRNKILASLLALSLCMGLTVPAFAVDTELGTDAGTNSAEITVTSELKIPTIKVTIGSPGTMIVNPYGMAVTVESAEVHDTLITSPALLTNDSDMNVKISAVPTVTVSADVTVQEDGGVIADGTTRKTISMTLYMAPNAAGTGTAQTLTGSEADVSSVPVKKNGSEAANITLEAKTAAASTYGSYQIKGYSAGTDWATGDTISTKIAFSIEPVIGTGTAT